MQCSFMEKVNSDVKCAAWRVSVSIERFLWSVYCSNLTLTSAETCHMSSYIVLQHQTLCLSRMPISLLRTGGSIRIMINTAGFLNGWNPVQTFPPCQVGYVKSENANSPRGLRWSTLLFFSLCIRRCNSTRSVLAVIFSPLWTSGQK